MTDPSTLHEVLWTPADLARFLGYKESTVVRMASMDRERLPPRIRTMSKPRWVPDICRAWVRENSRAEVKVRVGRPRKITLASSPTP
jgi:hypothetical protein